LDIPGSGLAFDFSPPQRVDLGWGWTINGDSNPLAFFQAFEASLQARYHPGSSNLPTLTDFGGALWHGFYVAAGPQLDIRTSENFAMHIRNESLAEQYFLPSLLAMAAAYTAENQAARDSLARSLLSQLKYTTTGNGTFHQGGQTYNTQMINTVAFIPGPQPLESVYSFLQNSQLSETWTFKIAQASMPGASSSLFGPLQIQVTSLESWSNGGSHFQVFFNFGWGDTSPSVQPAPLSSTRPF
jgi:hypothetical protein